MTTEKIAMHWINGEWVDSNPHRESIDPATYQASGSYADGGVEVAAAAIAAARRAFETTEWKRDLKLTFFPSTLTHPEPRLLIASHHEAIHDAGRS
jgi:hypothetical protein